MSMSKSAIRKMRRYRPEDYFEYMDALIKVGDERALRREIAQNVDSARSISVYQYVLDRRGKGKNAEAAEVAEHAWESWVRSLMPRKQRWGESALCAAEQKVQRKVSTRASHPSAAA